MADDPTLGELARNLARIETHLDRALKNSDDRVANLARDMVPTELWKAEHQQLQDEVKSLRDELREAIRDAVARVNTTSLERKAVLDGQIADLTKKLAGHEKAHAERSTWTRNRTLTTIGIIVGAAATIAGAWIAAVLAAKGVH